MKVFTLKNLHLFFLFLLGRSGLRGDRVLCKEYGCNLPDTFRLIGRAIIMTSLFGLRAMWTVGSMVEFRVCILWSLVRSPVRENTVYTAYET